MTAIRIAELMKQFSENVLQLDTDGHVLVFKDAHDMATQLNNCLENAIIETEQREV